MFSDKEKLPYLQTELSESLQELHPTKPSHVSVWQQLSVVAVSLHQMRTEQPSLKRSSSNRTENLHCHIHYLFHV